MSSAICPTLTWVVTKQKKQQSMTLPRFLAVQAKLQSHREASLCSNGTIWICAKITTLIMSEREKPKQSPGPVSPPPQLLTRGCDCLLASDVQTRWRQFPTAFHQVHPVPPPTPRSTTSKLRN